MVNASMKKEANSKIEKLVLEVPFIMKKEKNGYIAECVDLNIVTQGDTITETRKNIIEAINLHLKSAFELGILDDELEKLGVVKKNNKLEISQMELEHAPIQIPC